MSGGALGLWGLFRRKPRITPEEAATGLAQLLNQYLGTSMERLTTRPDTFGQVDARLCGRELFSLYVFAMDTALFQLYKSGGARESIMRSFWQQYDLFYDRSTPEVRATMPPQQEILSRSEEYASHFQYSDNPLIGIGETFSGHCGPPNFALAYKGASDFSILAPAVLDLLKKHTITS